MAKITIDPINSVAGNDILNSFQVAGSLHYSGTEKGLDGATLTFIYQINYGSNRIEWPGADPDHPTVAANGKWSTGVASGYATASRDGIYTITASAGGVSAGRTIITAVHAGQLGFIHSPFEAVGLAFDEETQQLAGTPSAPTFLAVDQYITAEQAGVNILQRDHIITSGQANKLENFFHRELQVLGKQALSADLLSTQQIDRLEHLQADTAAYVASTRALAALQPNDAGWTMPVLPTS